MNKTKKSTKIIALSGTMIASLLCAGLLLQTPVSVKAENDFAKIQGASVRYSKASEDETKSGLRFLYTVDNSDEVLGENLSNVKDMGMLLIPTSLMGESTTLTHSTDYVSDTKFIENGTVVAENPMNVGVFEGNKFTVQESGTTYGMLVYVYKLPEEMYNQTFTCVGYYQLKGENQSIVYSNSMERSIASVARAAYDKNDYTSATQKTSLESFLLDYTVTYAGEGVDKASEKVEYGKVPTATASIDGYDFDFWGDENGKKVETITGDVTLTAYYKKDGGTLMGSLTDGVSVAYSGEYTSVSINGKTVEAEAADGKITVSNAAFGGEEGTYTLAVHETVNKRTIYTVSAYDTTKDRAFATITTEYGKAVRAGTNTPADLSIVNETNGLPAGKTGDFFKVSSTHAEAGLKVKPAISEELLNLYNDGEVRFDYYVESATASSVHILSTRRDGTPNTSDAATEYYKVSSIVKGEWISISIPVATFTNVVNDNVMQGDGTVVNKDLSVYQNILNGFEGNQHNGKLFALAWEEGGGTFYVGNIQLVSKATIDAENAERLSNPVAWQEKTTDTSKVQGYDYGNRGAATITEAANMTIDTTLIAGVGSDWFYTFSRSGDCAGIKVATNLKEAELEERKDQYLVFAYYIDCVGKNATVQYVAGEVNGAAGVYYGSTANACNAWQLLSIPVDYLYEHYSAFASISSNRLGVLLESSEVSTTYTLYVSEMAVMTEEDKNAIFAAYEQAVADAEAAELLKPIDWQATPNMWGYENYKNNTTGISTPNVENIDSPIMDNRTLDSEFYYIWNVTLSSNDTTPAVFIPTTLTKAELEKRVGQYLFFEYYVDSPTNYSMEYMAYDANNSYEEVSGACNAWKQVIVPVQYIIDHYDAFSNPSGWTGNVLKSEYTTNKGEELTFYISELRIMPEDSFTSHYRKTVSFISIDKNFADARAWGASDRNTNLTTTTVDGEEYFKYSGKADYIGLYMNPTISKEMLEAYIGGTLTIKYKVTVGSDTEATFMLFSQAGYGNAKEKVKVTTGEWGTLTISVQDLYDNYDDIVSAWTSVKSGGNPNYLGKLIAVEKESADTLELYLGGFIITMPDA